MSLFNRNNLRRYLLGMSMSLVIFIPTIGMSNNASAATNTPSVSAALHSDALNVTSRVANATSIAAQLNGSSQSSDSSPVPNVNLSTTGAVSAIASDGTSIGMKLPNSAKNMQNVNGVMVTDPTASAVATVTPQSGGYQVAEQLSGPSAPTSYSYKLNLPTGYKPMIESNGFGGSIIALSNAAKGVALDKTNTIGFINPAWAVDANGNSVPTSYMVSGKTVIQTVDTSAVTAWPVVADPSVSFGWVIYVHWSHKEVQNILIQAFFAGIGTAAALACDFISVGLLIPVCTFLFAASTYAVISQFNTAYNRGGGLVWEFAYNGSPVGFMYVGNDWS